MQTFTGMSDRMLTCALGDGARGLALIAFGRGNVPPSIVGAVRNAVESGVLVTISSRCVAGSVKPRYGYEGGGLQLKQIGAVLAGDLSGAKARLLQMAALGLTNDVAQAAGVILQMVEHIERL